MIKLSVIIPVYNMEIYLSRCIDSILSQTYKNIEIILINDGSNDQSGSICDGYAERFDQIKVVHQPNMGVSSARNRGIKEASGDLIGFIDADDSIEPDMYQILIALQQKKQFDMVSCGVQSLNDKGEVIHQTANDGSMQVYSSNTSCVGAFVDNVGGISIWNRVYKASIIKQCQFPINIKNNEDKLFLFYVSKKVQSFGHLNNCFYNYHQREGSASNGKFSEDFFAIRDVSEIIEGDIKTLYPTLLVGAKRASIVSNLHLMRMLIQSSDYSKYNEKYGVLRTKVIKYAPVQQYDLGFVRKIEFFLVYRANPIYVLLVKLHKIIRDEI